MKNYIFAYAMLASTFLCLEAAQNANARYHSNTSDPSITQEKYDIIRRNQIENTDTLAIPLDDSEVEDEEEINQAEKKDVFNLPKSP